MVRGYSKKSPGMNFISILGLAAAALLATSSHLIFQETLPEKSMKSTKAGDLSMSITATGKIASWKGILLINTTVYSSKSFPRYSLRLKEGGHLCDQKVFQVSGYLDVDDDKHFYFW